MDRPFLPVPINNLKMACGCPIKSVLLQMKDPIFKFLDSLLPTSLEVMSIEQQCPSPQIYYLLPVSSLQWKLFFPSDFFYQSSALDQFQLITCGYFEEKCVIVVELSIFGFSNFMCVVCVCLWPFCTEAWTFFIF